MMDHGKMLRWQVYAGRFFWNASVGGQDLETAARMGRLSKTPRAPRPVLLSRSRGLFKKLAFRGS